MLRCPAVWLLLLVDLRNTVPHLLPHTPATPTFLRLDFIYPMRVPWSRDALPEGQVWLRGWRFPCSGSFLQLICCRTVTLHGLLRIRPAGHVFLKSLLQKDFVEHLQKTNREIKAARHPASAGIVEPVTMDA